MAFVYLAEDLRHHRKVAVKVLKPEFAAVVGAERFLQEITTTASLQHPHILPLYDSGEAEGLLYYVMPYVRGETLRERIDRERQLAVDEAVAIACDVAEALDFAHRHGVIHRDVKPENVLLQDGRPIVADFGVALAVQEAAGSRLTETGLSVGTRRYMSPEQVTAEHEVTARSDIYSLGAMLYELLSGEPPHTGANTHAVVLKILSTHEGTVDTLVARVLAEGGRFSPDGRWIVYVTDESGQPEVYVASWPRMTTRRQISVDGGRFPEWSRDSGELFLTKGDTLMVSRVTTGDSFTDSAPRALFASETFGSRSLWYSATSDGQRFLVAAANPDALSHELEVVVNWFEELRRR